MTVLFGNYGVQSLRQREVSTPLPAGKRLTFISNARPMRLQKTKKLMLRQWFCSGAVAACKKEAVKHNAVAVGAFPDTLLETFVTDTTNAVRITRIYLNSIR
ncbi:hypothetical protein BLL42_07515 [Pseudomonas frederiksbergensis]|uniref:Uncharacterized protein n=1 Tax=Pseudomonas frederiksbergensis TaxID=104087 RepID=A0A1J0EHR5_9PSED|nr:hypothetical protein [Pseudomonas frederiksbergensis]APC15582.1 hypothetical protein BLL42_07515 [Pseudomonas frederiksbergensis]